VGVKRTRTRRKEAHGGGGGGGGGGGHLFLLGGGVGRGKTTGDKQKVQSYQPNPQKNTPLPRGAQGRGGERGAAAGEQGPTIAGLGAASDDAVKTKKRGEWCEGAEGYAIDKVFKLTEAGHTPTHPRTTLTPTEVKLFWGRVAQKLLFITLGYKGLMGFGHQPKRRH